MILPAGAPGNQDFSSTAPFGPLIPIQAVQPYRRQALGLFVCTSRAWTGAGIGAIQDDRKAGLVQGTFDPSNGSDAKEAAARSTTSLCPLD